MSAEYRVETRNKVDGTGWWPENDHLVFAEIERAERWRDDRRAWYSNPDRFEHRIVARQVSDWQVVQ